MNTKTRTFGFNSKLVRLKGYTSIWRDIATPERFNSKLVRLKVDNLNCQIYFLDLFQFQTGAIKSTGVRGNHDATSHVSIPNWCD